MPTYHVHSKRIMLANNLTLAHILNYTSSRPYFPSLCYAMVEKKGKREKHSLVVIYIILSHPWVYLSSYQGQLSKVVLFLHIKGGSWG